MKLSSREGAFAGYSEEAISLRTGQGEVAIPRADVLSVKNWKSSHRGRDALLGLAIGAAGGLAIGAVAGATYQEEARFDFLGYTFGPHRSKKDGHWYLGVSPSRKSVARLKRKVHAVLRPAEVGRRALHDDYVFVGELTENLPARIRSIATFAGGKRAHDFEYDLAETPCKNEGRHTNGVRQQ